jgi:hypothetical protein
MKTHIVVTKAHFTAHNQLARVGEFDSESPMECALMNGSLVVVVVLSVSLSTIARGQRTLEPCPSVRVPTAVPAADFVVTVLGNVISRPERPVIEEDRVRVRVLATDALAPLLSVHRTSPARRTGELRIIGMPETADAKTATEAQKAMATPTCYIESTLGDFRPGLGEVEVRLAMISGAEIKRLTIGAFDFNVEPVFAGMVSIGPVITWLPDPAFQLATNAQGNTYISEVESGRERIAYALAYTPFIWGKRVAEPPLTRDLRSWRQRINPMFGLVINDIRRNALGGLSLDLPFGLVVQGGWHVGRTSEIDPSSGLQVGSEFPSTGTIPIRRRWDSGHFLALTLDTRVALKLFGLAGSSAVQ